MFLSALVLLTLSPAPLVIQELPMERVHLVRVEVGSDPADFAQLAALGIDLSEVHLGRVNDTGNGERTAEFVVDGEELASMRRLGWDAQVLVEDLASFYANRLMTGAPNVAGAAHGSWLNPPFGTGAMSGYYNVPQIASVLDQIQAAYPTLVSAKVSIGQSHEGRDLWMVKVSDNPNVDENEPEVRFDAMHHAREPEGMQASLWFMLWLVEEYGTDPLATFLVNEREMYFIPCVNPDGYAYNEQISPQGGGMWRKNRRINGGGVFGVDLNRNYDYQWAYDNLGSSGDPSSDVYRGPSAASEPEVQAMSAFIASRDFNTVLTLHTYGNYWLAPLGYIPAHPANGAQYDEIGALATEFNGYQYGPASTVLYEANGTTLDYDHGVYGSMAWTPELGSNSDGFWPPQNRIVPLAEENRIALARTARAAGAYLHVESIAQSELIGDGDGDYEGGETVSFQVELRNSGVLGSAPLEIQLHTTDAQLEIQVGAAALGSLSAFSTVVTTSAPSLRILPGTAAGAHPFEIRVVAGAWQESFFGELIVGSQIVLASYDFEATGDEGWALGAPNNASTGIWTRVNPIGTAAQPEDDHTAGPGNTICWVTGQGSPGGSIGENDVDGGTTSLVTPAFDLAGVDNAVIRYWRWYSNNGNGAVDDVFEVDLSNDDGANWAAVEVLGPAGAGTTGGWLEVSLYPGDFLPLTNQMRVRFRASDLGSGSIVEAGIDDFTVGYLANGGCPPAQIYCQTTANSVGAGATLSTSGSTGVADGSFTLHASGMPVGSFGLFFYGATQGTGPLGDGALCIAPPFTRLAVQQADAAGAVQQLLPFGTPLVAGSTWNFQFWYRDPVGGPAGFNLSDAVNVLFCN